MKSMLAPQLRVEVPEEMSVFPSVFKGKYQPTGSEELAVYLDSLNSAWKRQPFYTWQIGPEVSGPRLEKAFDMSRFDLTVKTIEGRDLYVYVKRGILRKLVRQQKFILADSSPLYRGYRHILTNEKPSVGEIANEDPEKPYPSSLYRFLH